MGDYATNLPAADLEDTYAMSKVLGCLLIAAGVAVGGLAAGLTGDRSEAAVDHTYRSAPTPADKPLLAALSVAAPDQALRKPIAPFQTSTVPNDPASLARALQGELRRVGCYASEINGIWTPTSKRAMKAFTERVNATLPIDKPDYVLLALVQSQTDTVCGATCPAGQLQTPEGRCSPAAIVAQAAKRQQAQNQPRVAAVTPPPQPTAMLKPSSAPVAALEKPAGWIVKVEPAPNAPASERAPFPSDTPRMALAGPTPPETAPAPTATESEPKRRHVAKHRPERRHYAEAPRRPNNWVASFFRSIDPNSF